MPKRTKEEKKLAQERNQSKLLNRYKIVEPPLITPSSTPVKPVKAEKQEALTQTISQEDILVKNYFVGDLRKSILFIAIIFALEFFLYFVTFGK